MIIKANCIKYEPEVLDAMDELFNHCLRNEKRQNDFLVFLENGHFDSSLPGEKGSQYVIGQGVEGAKDSDRMTFVEFYLEIPFEEQYNSANNFQDQFDVRVKSTSLSMMVYTHFWESKVFLRKLRLLALLAEGQEYDWHIEVRPKETYKYIKNNIMDVFEKHALKIFDILKRTYRSQLRNAFAHSDYYLSDDKVYLDNFNARDGWSVEYLDYDDFDKIITLTLLIHHAMVIKIEEFREELGRSNPERQIFVPEGGGVTRTLYYRQTGSIMRWLWKNQF